LTHHPSEWLSPAWSPDGTELAFHRFAGEDTGIYTVPALGGPERKLRATHIQYYANAPISWSPDAKSIAFGDSTDEGDRIFLLSNSTLETSMIRHDPECVHEAQPTFSHSGKELAYLCVHSLVQVELRSLDFPDGQPRILATFHPLNGIAWSADDSKLVVSVQPLIYNFRHYFRLAETELGANTGCEMYEVPREGGQARRLDYAANGAWPAISAKGNKFAYSRDDGKAKVWRQDLLRPDAPATPLLTSTQNQGDAHFSPNGNRIVFESTRAGSSDIWISDADGANPARLSKLNGVAWCPRWSPDSKKVAFVLNQSEHSDIYCSRLFRRSSQKITHKHSGYSNPKLVA
jgi:Tol biopolymer transport system component